MTETVMRFSLCTHCNHIDRYPDDAVLIGPMCNGCGHFGSQRFIGVTEPSIAKSLRDKYPDPTVSEHGTPVGVSG